MTKKTKTAASSDGGIFYANKSGKFQLVAGKLLDAAGKPMFRTEGEGDSKKKIRITAAEITKEGGPLKRVKLSKKTA